MEWKVYIIELYNNIMIISTHLMNYNKYSKNVLV